LSIIVAKLLQTLGYHVHRPSYRKDKAEGVWKRMLAWFKKYGVA
jgi:hypothetical protein